MTRSRPRRPADRRAHGHLNAYGRHGHGQPYVMAGGVEERHVRGVQRRDRRRERRLRRRLGGNRRGFLFLLALALGMVVAVVGVSLAIGFVLFQLFRVLLVVAVFGGAFLLLRRAVRRSRAGGSGPVAPPGAESGPDAWRRSRTAFDQLRSEYSAHECDPMRILRRPALSDVSVPSTARFVDAFAEAQSLDTDAYPGAPHDAAYAAAVAKAWRAWQAAQDAADRIRLSSVPPQERGSVERVLKLLTTARDSDSEPERLAAYARARSELDRLDRAGIVHLPRTARAALDEASRGALPG